MTRKFKTALLPTFAAIVSTACFIILIGTASHNQKTNSDNEGVEQKNTEVFSSRYSLSSPPMPKTLQFAGEEVPINRYDVREALDRELMVNIYWQSNILLYCKRAYRYFPVIEPILKKEGIPEDFKYLALVESGFTNVVSPAKATGFWQFMKATALSYGLEISEEVDERYNLEKSTVAACKFLKRAYNQHNSWSLAAASYNVGEGRLGQSMTNQKTSSYWDLFINEETSRYVYRILAAKLILSNPQDYGIRLRLTDLYQPLQVSLIEVDYSIDNLVDFALKHGVSYKQLKNLNPWLRSDKLTNKTGKKYHIAIPKKEYLIFENQIKDIDTNEMLKRQ